MKENNKTKKLPGFYIALCCCVIAIGVAGFVIQGNDTTTETPVVSSETDDAYLADESEPEEEPLEVAYETAPTPEPVIEDISVPDETAVEDYTYDNPDVVPAAVVVNAEESCNFIDPVPEMTVKFGLCTDTLMYNECYGDWRTHNGIDVDAPVGCSVNATAAGTIKDVSKGSYGNTVTIEHADGFTSVYAQLGEVNVKVGDTIEQGSVVGTVGESIGENLKTPHLHYELYKDEKPVNPEEY